MILQAPPPPSPAKPAAPSKDTKERPNIFREPNENELYQPSVIHLKCRGRLHLASPTNSLPICKGIADRLETVREYPPMKPHQALHTFTKHTSFYHPDPDDESAYEAGFGDYPKPSKSTSTTTHTHNQKKKKTEHVNLPHVVDTKWQEMKETLQEQTSIDLSKLSTTKLDMKLYGTSSAYLLVLRPYSDLNKAVDIDATNDDTRVRVRVVQMRIQVEVNRHRHCRSGYCQIKVQACLTFPPNPLSMVSTQ